MVSYYLKWVKPSWTYSKPYLCPLSDPDELGLDDRDLALQGRDLALQVPDRTVFLLKSSFPFVIPRL